MKSASAKLAALACLPRQVEEMTLDDHILMDVGLTAAKLLFVCAHVCTMTETRCEPRSTLEIGSAPETGMVTLPGS